MQSVQETQNEPDLAVGKRDFEKFRGFPLLPAPPPPGRRETEGGTKQAWRGKEVSCFCGWCFPLFGASLCDTSRWWELGGEHRIKGAVADHPSPAESYRAALALWGLSIAGKRQLGRGRQRWSSPSPFTSRHEEDGRTRVPTDSWAHDQLVHEVEAGFVNPIVVCRPTALHHGGTCFRPTDVWLSFVRSAVLSKLPLFNPSRRPLFLEFLLLAPENHPSNWLPLPDFFCRELFPAILSSIIRLYLAHQQTFPEHAPHAKPFVQLLEIRANNQTAVLSIRNFAGREGMQESNEA